MGILVLVGELEEADDVAKVVLAIEVVTEFVVVTVLVVIVVTGLAVAVETEVNVVLFVAKIV